MTERLKKVELRQDFESSTLRDKISELKAEKQMLETNNTALASEKDEIITVNSQFRTQIMKQLEEKIQALNLYKAELGGFKEAERQAKA